MSVSGGIPAYGGAPTSGAGRRALPRELRVVHVLVHVLFGATVLGGLGLLGSALSADAMDGLLLGLVLYGAAPGVVGWVLSRRIWTGGKGVWTGLIAVQAWLILGGVANIGDGSGHGFAQLFLPVLILLFLMQSDSREWFALPEQERVDKPEFSLSHMIAWRRDRGQTALEYLGLVLIVVAIIGGLVATGIGQELTSKISAQVCRIGGGSDCGDDGTTTVEAGDDEGTEGTDGSGDPGDADTGGSTGGSTTTGGTTGTGGASGIGGSTGSTGGSAGTSGTAGATGSAGATGGADGGPTGGTGGSSTGNGGATGGTNGGTSGGPDGGTTAGPNGSGDTYPETHEEPEAAYDVPASATDESEAGDGGDKGDEEDCGGWGFFGCAWDRGTQVVKGIFVDGIGGDITGIIDLFKPETWSGMADYGSQLGDQWTEDSKDAGEKWDNGDYLGALGDWGGASLNTVVKVGDDVFVGDEVRDRWNNGEKTRAVTDVVWNVGSLFIPGYDVAKVVGKVGKLGKLGKIAEEVAEAAGDAGEAAKKARKAADAGDVDGARKAAKEADEAADEAEEKARRTGCTIASGPPPRPGFAGVAGSGTGVLAGGPPDRVILATEGCDTEAKAKAEAARKQEREAWTAKKRAEEKDRAAKAAAKKKPWPDPKKNDTSDPRNYNDPDWADDLNDPELGSADKGDGYWGSRDRNPKPNWKNESWLRYQEQITGTQRGKEYIVAHPKEGKSPVEYDGWDSSRQTFLEAKNGYKSYLSKSKKGTLTKSGKDKFLTEARGQIAAAGGRPIEWHFSDPEVAKAARRAFQDARLPIKVIHTKQKPTGGTRKPEAFG
ncbi:Tox-REase-5 domain-containing protein [Streptomyces sp. NPDC057445]|uniref:Tox-REase-5 domain-containing protein n=1 Tax=Streptomyces sp. NPDC057445 TaxID=3346136 RepID=UPI0036898847